MNIGGVTFSRQACLRLRLQKSCFPTLDTPTNLFWRMETGHVSTGFHSSPLTGASCKFLGCLANAKDLVARVEGHGLGGAGKRSNGWRDGSWVKDSTVAFRGSSGWYCSNVYREEDVSRKASGTLN